MELLAELDGAERQLARALKLLEPKRITNENQPVSQDMMSMKEEVIRQLRQLRRVMVEEDENVQEMLRARDEEIRRLRMLLEQPHHIVPPLAYRYDRRPSREKGTYRGPLLMEPSIFQNRQQYVPIEHRSPDEQRHIEQELRDVVVCYMMDGSEKYTPMTVNAISSLQNVSPGVNIGIITSDIDFAQQALREIPDPANITYMPKMTHWAEWNATQHKLDLAQFADKFRTIIWMDSDTLVYRDIRPFLIDFHRSPEGIALMPDLVMHDDGFKQRWVGDASNMFIPQASLMGFKSNIIRQLFAAWERNWNDWISPAPFSKYHDPMPGFSGSAFCIEQYALGMTLESRAFGDIFMIGRQQVFVTVGAHGSFTINVVPFIKGFSIPGLSGLSYGSLIGVMGSLNLGGFMNLSLGYSYGSYRLGLGLELGSYGSYATSSGVNIGENRFMMDDVAGSVLHLYSQRYEAMHRWLQDHLQDLMPHLQQPAPPPQKLILRSTQ